MFVEQNKIQCIFILLYTHKVVSPQTAIWQHKWNERVWKKRNKE